MKSRDRTVNEFEKAILDAIRGRHDLELPQADDLTVLRREFTGVGSYTTFVRTSHADEGQRSIFSLDALIEVPGVPNGMGAALFLSQGEPDFLECFTYTDSWDGTFVGFRIVSG